MNNYWKFKGSQKDWIDLLNYLDNVPKIERWKAYEERIKNGEESS
jgi:hypothetical protein